MAELRQFDPLQVVGSWTPGGASIDILDGRLSGEFFSTAQDNARWAREFDAHGNATRVKNNNKGGSFSITLSASSPTNLALTRIAQSDDTSSNQVGALVLKDLNGTTVLEADGCFIENMPELAFGQDRGSRTWTFQCASMKFTVGGHNLA